MAAMSNAEAAAMRSAFGASSSCFFGAPLAGALVLVSAEPAALPFALSGMGSPFKRAASAPMPFSTM